MLTDLILKSFRYWKEKPQQEETVDVGKTIERRKTEIQWTALVNAKIDGRDDGVVRQRRRFIYGRDRSAVQGSGRSGHTTTFFRRWLRNERSFVSRRPVLTLALSHYAPTDFFRPEFLVRQKKKNEKAEKNDKKRSAAIDWIRLRYFYSCLIFLKWSFFSRLECLMYVKPMLEKLWKPMLEISKQRPATC